MPLLPPTAPLASLALLFPLLFPPQDRQAAQDKTPAQDKPASQPKAGELNRYVLQVLKTYPTDGSYGYFWPQRLDAQWKGNATDLHYRGKLFAKGDPKHRSFCCGLTFAVYLHAYERWCKHEKQTFVIPNFETAEKLKDLRHQWFGSDGNRRCSDHALRDNGLGTRIKRLEHARPGDFVQFWRRPIEGKRTSGHSAIFIAWARDPKNPKKITGLRYWSSQPSTKGIGYKVESFAGEKAIETKRLYITRAGAPRTAPRIR